jgi:hypothetical protein
MLKHFAGAPETGNRQVKKQKNTGKATLPGMFRKRILKKYP